MILPPLVFPGGRLFAFSNLVLLTPARASPTSFVAGSKRLHGTNTVAFYLSGIYIGKVLVRKRPRQQQWLYLPWPSMGNKVQIETVLFVFHHPRQVEPLSRAFFVGFLDKLGQQK